MLKNSALIFLLLCVSCASDSSPKEEVSTEEKLEETPVSVIEPEVIDTVIEEVFDYDYDTTRWTELVRLNEEILLDLRYATANNFVKSQLYECGRCLLRPEVAEAVVKAHQLLGRQGLGLKMYDCYRPRPVQQKLWDIVPNASYVTPPAKGSMHNRGCAVDLTLVDKEGNELDMGTEFDFFGKAAHHTTLDLPAEVLANRRLLKETMAAVGLKSIRTEWWHYSYPGCSYELSDMLWECGGEGE